MANDDATTTDPREAPEPATDGPTREVSGAARHGSDEPSSGAQLVTEPGPPSTRLDLLPGKVLGRYRVLEPLGRGGMGIVLRALDEVVGRTIALKVLHSEDERDALRLKREAQAMAQLSHPNIVQVYEVGKAQGHWFIAMELVEGQTLRRWQQGPHDWKARLDVYLQAGEGLAAAHAEGLVHRDFKPDNCIVDRSGRPRVLDFGLVHGSSSSFVDESLESHADLDPADVLVTRTGAVLGTVAYMSLEQLNGRPAHARSDQFSFCVALYEALYGERPFTGTTVGRLTISVMNGLIRAPPKGTAVPARVREVVLRGLALEPAERWPSMATLLAELRRATRPSRKRWWVAGVGVSLLAGVWLSWPGTPAPPSCADARAQLDGVWDDERRGVVEAAIVDTKLPYAADTWERVARQLDAFGDAWAGTYTDACEATNVRREQSPEVMDLRMRCLARQRSELQEVVQVLVEASPERVQRAVDLVSSLPEPARCNEVEALLAELPPPQDPAAAQQVEALRQQLAQARSLWAAGEREGAMSEAESVTERAQTLDYSPLLAEALELRGALRSAQGEYAEAEADLERAYLLAVELGYDALALDTVTRLTSVVGHYRAEHERGMRWSRTGEALAERLDAAPSALAELQANTGAILADQGKHDEALAHYRRARDLWQQAGARPLDVARTLGNIGGVLVERGQLDEALEQYRQVQAIGEEAYGPDHPYVATALNNIGSVLSDQGKHDEALVGYRRALAIWERAYGSDHPYVGNALANISTCLLARGEPDEALADLQRALAIWEQALGPQHPQVGQLHVNLGNVQRQLRKPDEALEHLRRALGILEESLGPDHPDLGLVLDNMGITLEDLGRLDEAKQHYRRAIATWERALGPKFPKIAMSLVGLAEISLVQGEPEAARAFALRALQIREEGEVAPEQLAETRFLLARALWSEQGEQAQARLLAEQALATYLEVGGIYEDDGEAVKAWLEQPGDSSTPHAAAPR